MQDYNIKIIKELQKIGVKIKVNPNIENATIGYEVIINTPFYLPNRKYKCEILSGTHLVVSKKYGYGYGALLFSDEILLEEELLKILTKIINKYYKSSKEVIKLLKELERVSIEKNISNPYYDIVYNVIKNTYIIYYRGEIGNTFSQGSMSNLINNLKYNINVIKNMSIINNKELEYNLFNQ